MPGALGEAIVDLEDGIVTPEAKGFFEAAEQVAPEDPRPAFYLAQADIQAGRFGGQRSHG